MNYTEASDWETEINEGSENANALKVNEVKNGSIVKSWDYDWYKFTIPADGYITIDFTHTKINSSATTWKIYLYESDGFTLCEDDNAIWSVSGSDDYQTRKIGVLAGDYYIKITDENVSYNNHWSDVTYNLKIKFVNDNTWEIESNDSSGKANTVVNMRKGYLENSSDVDWYKVYIGSYTNVVLLFNHNYVDTSSVCWKVTVYSSDAITELIQIDIKGNQTGEEATFNTTSSGYYYIKVAKGSYNIWQGGYNSSTAEYNFSILA